ncbi:MAG TPA: dihydropteroate synthase [Dehalococcoidales bacterium]|nr:dihydropteroate synthase [Dehalococcoidales bacterium]
MSVPGITRCGLSEFRWGERTYIMGIVNVSPESFSGDGLADADAAVEQAQRFVTEGADILDIGGESTRPGSSPISIEEEVRRVVPVIERIARKVNVPLSIDTYKSEVAVRALEAGAAIINDQWGLKKDPGLAELAAARDVPIILMSNQRDKGGYDTDARRDTAFYEDVIAEVISSLWNSIETALVAGVPRENIIIDPGLGFGKTWQQDIEILRRLAELKELGQPILIGPSRKSMIKMVLDLPADDRVEGTAATVAIGIANGADIVRVHDVRQMVRVCRMTDAIVRG